ncbi:hypothetical protein D3C86_1733950 [compost metagenome]
MVGPFRARPFACPDEFRNRLTGRGAENIRRRFDRLDQPCGGLIERGLRIRRPLVKGSSLDQTAAFRSGHHSRRVKRNQSAQSMLGASREGRKLAVGGQLLSRPGCVLETYSAGVEALD